MQRGRAQMLKCSPHWMRECMRGEGEGGSREEREGGTTGKVDGVGEWERQAEEGMCGVCQREWKSTVGGAGG